MEQNNSATNNSQQSGQTGNSGQAGNSDGQAGNSGGQSWYDGFTKPELKSYIQKKGFENAETLADSYLNLEKLAGGDRKNLIKLPDDLGSAEMSPLWERLGKPKEAKEYTFNLPEDLKPYTPEAHMEKAKELSFKHNIPRRQIEGFMKDWLEFRSGEIKTEIDGLKAKHSEDTKELEKNWGKGHKENLNIVANTAKRLGLTDQEWQTMQGAFGIKRSHDIMYEIGKGSRESDFVGNDKGASTRAPTSDEARGEIKQLMRDSDFARRLSSGDVEARKKWDKLHESVDWSEKGAYS